MNVVVYFDDIRETFLRANSVLWEIKHTTSIAVPEQIKAWKEIHNATIFGGHYDLDENGKPKIATRAIGLVFETKEDFVLFMFKWS